MSEMIFKTYPFVVKEIADRILEFVGSTEDMDRDGEVVEVAGWKLDNYMKNPVFMWAHDYKEPPIGKALKVWKRDGQLKFNIEFAPKETYEFADTIYKLYKGGFLNATSVGFIPDPESIIEGDGAKTPRRTYKKQELLELSGVSIPSNTNALRNAIDNGVITIKEFEVVTKPEETDEYIRIPVDRGNHEGHRIRTIDISTKEGIKAIYCGECKKVMTYLFAKDHGWTMAKAQAWVKEHEKKSIEVEHEISQEEIKDELDYLDTMITQEGLSKETAFDAVDVAIRTMARAWPYHKWESITLGENLTGESQAIIFKRISGSDIPVEDIKEKFSRQIEIVELEPIDGYKTYAVKTDLQKEIQEAIRRIANKMEVK